MRLLTIEAYGTPDKLHIDTTYIGQQGDVFVLGEKKGRALFAGADQLTETGWRFMVVCDDATADVVTKAVRAGMLMELLPDDRKPRLRDKLRVRAARWWLSPVPAR